MDRAERIGLGVAIAGHALLFALLSARFFSVPVPTPVQQQPIEVSLVKDVALQAAAPKAVEPPAPSIAPDRGAPEDAAPPEPVDAAPEPEPKPARPVEKPAPAPKPIAAAKPAPVKKSKPEPAAPEKSAAKSMPAKASPAKASTSAAPSHPNIAAAKGTGSDTAAKISRPRGSLLGDDFLKGLTDKPSKSRSTAPVAAKVDARALGQIQDAIRQQIQPCANRQNDPGPGANAIVTTFNLHLNEDGSLAATPRMVRQTGINDDNSRYAQRVVDLGIAAFKGCSPLKLPNEYYSTPAGGWNNINYKWQLR